MKVRIKPALVAGLFLIGAAAAALTLYAYTQQNARRIFKTMAAAATSRPVEARTVRAVFLAGIVIEGLSIEGIFSCPQVRIDLDVLTLLHHDIRIRSVEFYSPLIVWDNSAFPEPGMPSTAAAAPASPAAHARTLMLSSLLVHDGVLKIIRHPAGGEKQEFLIDRIELNATQVPLGQLAQRTDFALTLSLAKLNAPFVGHFMKARGWLNWAERDMDAAAQVIDDDGRKGLDVHLVSRRNALNVAGTVKLLGDQSPQAAGARSGMVESVALNALSATATDIEARFSFDTHMDHFDIGPVKFSGEITTGLNSSVTSGNIVAGLKAAADELFKDPSAAGIKK